MREALVIAITRMGDLVQTEPFCRALKRAGMERVTLLTEEAFVTVASALQGVDEVVSLKFADVLPHFRQVSSYPVAALNGAIEALRTREFQQVWNLTHTRPSMMLTAAIGGSAARGVTIDSSGLQIVRNDWLRYFFATNLARPWSVFNLVDVYVNAACATMPFSERIPRLKNVENNRGSVRDYRRLHVAIHPGASQRDKQWPLDRFQTLATSLLARGAEITLIGGKGDRSLGDAFSRHTRLANRIGETPIGDLINLLADVDLLVSADSGPVHIAAAAGTKVIAIEGGSAHGWETAPYGSGHWILQPHLKDLLTRIPDKKVASACADVVSVTSVLSTIETAIGERELPGADDDVSIYETVATAYSLDLKTRAGRNDRIDVCYSALRELWRKVLLSNQAEARTTSSAASQCAALARKLATAPLATASRIERLASELHARQKTLLSELLTQPQLHALARFLEISLASVEGSSLGAQARETAEVFEQIARGLEGSSLETHLSVHTMKHNNMREETCASI
ncbi:glycosyltransferase family 9 protein [bacterium]|nr:glycosyltransferase family 9 protein [bacterium]